MKKYFLLLLLVTYYAIGSSQNRVPIWNVPAYAGSNLAGAKFLVDLNATTTRSVTYDILKAQIITDSIYASKLFVYKIKDSLISIFASQYVSQTRTITINGVTFDLSLNRTWSVGTVINISSGYGMSFSSVTTSGSITVDSLTMASWLHLYKVKDSIFSVVYTKSQSDANYYPITGGSLSNTTNGWIGLPQLTSSPAALTNFTILYRDSAGGYAFRYPTGYIRAFRAVNVMTANRTVYYPDSTGTMALKEYSVQISDTSAMLAGYTRQGQGVVFVYDSSAFTGLGTGASPFTLITQPKIVAGFYTAPTLHITNKGIIDSITSGPGSVGPFLYLATQSTVVGPGAAGRRIYDSAGINFITTSGIISTFSYAATLNRTYTFPDTTLIVAGQNIQNSFSVGQIINFSGTNQLKLQNGAGFSLFNQATNGGLTIALSGNNLTIPNTNTSNLTVGSGSTFQIGGAFINKRVTKADIAYTASATADYLIAYTSLTATRAVTAPASPTTNQVLVIKDEAGNAATFNITFVGTLDGATNPALVNTNFGCRAIYYNGTNWFTLYKFGFGWIAIIVLGSIALRGIKPKGMVIQMNSRIAA
jgi:hypothetical protein